MAQPVDYKLWPVVYVELLTFSWTTHAVVASMRCRAFHFVASTLQIANTTGILQWLARFANGWKQKVSRYSFIQALNCTYIWIYFWRKVVRNELMTRSYWSFLLAHDKRKVSIVFLLHHNNILKEYNSSKTLQIWFTRFLQTLDMLQYYHQTNLDRSLSAVQNLYGKLLHLVLNKWMLKMSTFIFNNVAKQKKAAGRTYFGATKL